MNLNTLSILSYKLYLSFIHAYLPVYCLKGMAIADEMKSSAGLVGVAMETWKQDLDL